MDADEYQREAMRTRAPASEDLRIDLAIVGLGLTGEAGEVADLIKKHIGQGHPLDKAKLRRELGDIFWYLALAAEVLSVPLSEILGENLEKLRARYPEGFSSERSQQRQEAQTRFDDSDETAAAESAAWDAARAKLLASAPARSPSLAMDLSKQTQAVLGMLTPKEMEVLRRRVPLEDPLDPGFIPSDS